VRELDKLFLSRQPHGQYTGNENCQQSQFRAAKIRIGCLFKTRNAFNETRLVRQTLRKAYWVWKSSNNLHGVCYIKVKLQRRATANRAKQLFLLLR